MRKIPPNTTHRKSAAPQRRASARPFQALIWTDMQPLLEAERAQCRKTSEKLSALLEQISQHREKDQPRYQQWLNAKFGVKMTEIREIEARHSELEQLVMQVEDLVFWNDWSHEHAYEHMTQVQSGMKKIEELRREQFQQASQESGQMSFEDMIDESPEIGKMLRLIFEEMVGPAHLYSRREYARMFSAFKKEFAEDVIDRDGDRGHKNHQEQDYERHRSQREEKSSRAQRSSRAEQSDSEADERKQLYRTLARRLHPDLNANLSTHDNELWLEVQSAYEARDLERLQTVSALLERNEESGKDGVGLDRIFSVSRLKTILKSLGKKLRAAQKTIREAKKTPSWQFSQIENDPILIKKMSDEVTEELTEALSEIRTELLHLERKIKRWSSGGRNAKPTAVIKKRSKNHR